MTRVKICGIKELEHALLALEYGADLLGFIFYPPSHRYVEPERVREIVGACRARFGDGWQAVGVFVNAPHEGVNSIADLAALDLVQLCGDETPEYCSRMNRPSIRVVRVNADGRPIGPIDPAVLGAQRILLDTDRPGSYGGTGATYDWATARPYASKALLAGGLSPANVATAIRLAQPWGVDVSSGVEMDNRKHPDLIRRFLEEVKGHAGAC